MSKNHFAATGFVFNSENKILMIHHNKYGVWLPPGGHIEENELPDDALLREIFEETGIKAKIIPTQKLGLSEKYCKELAQPFVVLLEDIESNGLHNHIDLIYLCRAVNENYTMNEKEVHGIGWFTVDEIKQLKTFDNVIKTAEKALKFILIGDENL